MERFRNIKNSILNFAKAHKIWTGLMVLIVILVLFFLRPRAPKPVASQRVERENIIQLISITGTLDSQNSAKLSFLTGGKVVFIGAKEGDFVNAFQTIAVLDERTAQKNLEASLIDYSKQRNTFDQTQEDNQNRKPSEALNDQMKRLLEDNQLDLNKAINSVELRDLVKQDSVLTTPISGIVTQADISNAGLTMRPTDAFVITDPSTLEFKMEVDEADIGKVKIGQPVNIVLDAYPNQTLKLTVDDIDFKTHTTSTGGNAYYVKSRIEEDNSDFHFRVGMNGNADIITGEANNVLVIPLSSIIEDNKVFVKTKKGFEKKTIRLGLQNDTSAEVRSGLSEGEEVATEPSNVPQNLSTAPRIPFVRRFFR